MSKRQNAIESIFRAALGFLLSFAASAQVALVNPSFEQPALAAGQIAGYSGPS